MARALEYLMSLYPDKTAKEILELQKKDEAQDKKNFENNNKKKLEFIQDINSNGGYFRGRFGEDQHYFYRVFDLELQPNGEILMKVEQLILFYNDSNDIHQITITKPNQTTLERRIKDYEKLDDYGLNFEKRVTKKEWDEVNQYLNNMSKLFWGDIKKVE